MNRARRSLRAVLVGATGVAAAGLALAGARSGATVANTRPASLPHYDGATFVPHWRPVEHRVGRFHLVDQQGRPFRDTHLDGRIHVASFIFATCPNVCPRLVQRLRRVQDAARAFPDVHLVSYSVTPTIDTPQLLFDYGRVHGVDPAVWTLATGDAAQIESLARNSYFADDSRKLPATGERQGLLHTEKVLLVDRHRRLRGVYDGTQPFEIERLLEDIAVLRADEGEHEPT